MSDNTAKSQYTPRIWPRKITIDQDGPGTHRASIQDAETGKTLDAVLAITMNRLEGSWIELTMAAHEPYKPASMRDESDVAFAVEHGVLVERRKYRIMSLHADCEG